MDSTPTPTRSIDDIAAELFAHPEFVIGNFLTRDHLTEAGIDPDKVDSRVAEWAADSLSEEMMEHVHNALPDDDED